MQEKWPSIEIRKQFKQFGIRALYAQLSAAKSPTTQTNRAELIGLSADAPLEDLLLDEDVEFVAVEPLTVVVPPISIRPGFREREKTEYSYDAHIVRR